jgi:putative oxidoreductase
MPGAPSAKTRFALLPGHDSHKFRARRKHFARRIIPVLLCKTPAVFVAAMCFPLTPRHDTNWARQKPGGAFMNQTLAAWAPRALSVLRIITGLMIIEHGMGKIIGFPAFPAYANVQPLSLIGAAGFIELICGALLILGLLTRPAAFILAGEMAFAYFIAHEPKSFYPLINGGTLAIMYCFTCLYLAAAGAGPWSVDAALKQD